jgi:3-oxoacyl-[acyl-carrier-protein] synthase-3
LRAAIASIGSAIPPRAVSSADLAHRLDVTDEWIRSRTGIRERRVAPTGGVSELIVPAAVQCIERRGITADEVDCIIVATTTPDYLFPPTAAIVQGKLGTRAAWAFDLSAACSGFAYALLVGEGLIATGRARRVLLCAGERMSAITNPDDRGTSILFGDAATAVLLEAATEDDEGGIIDSVCRTDPVDPKLLSMPAGGSARPASLATVLQREHFVVQDGPAVFRAAVEGLGDVTSALLERNGLGVDDIDWLIPHQANRRIIDAVARRVGVPQEKVASNIDHYGNTAATSIPLCIAEWYERGNLRRGGRVVLASFGAGFTMSAVYLRWSMAPLAPVVSPSSSLSDAPTRKPTTVGA